MNPPESIVALNEQARLIDLLFDEAANRLLPAYRREEARITSDFTDRNYQFSTHHLNALREACIAYVRLVCEARVRATADAVARLHRPVDVSEWGRVSSFIQRQCSDEDSEVVRELSVTAQLNGVDRDLVAGLEHALRRDLVALRKSMQRQIEVERMTASAEGEALVQSGMTSHSVQFHGPVNMVNSQVSSGGGNTQIVRTSLEHLSSVVEASSATEAQKAEAKGLLSRIAAHPIFTAVLAGAAEAVVSSALKKQ